MSSPHQTVNPWTWQDQFGFAQAVATTPPSRWLFLAGQGPADADGATVPGDIGAQLSQCFDNLQTVLTQAGADLSHVVRLNLYTTDVDALLGVWNMITDRLGGGRLPTGQHSARSRSPRLPRHARRDRGDRAGALRANRRRARARCARTCGEPGPVDRPQPH